MSTNIDATDQVVGRLATKIANLLMGKNHPKYQPYHYDYSEEVVVSNAAKVKFTGKKWEQKKYTRYSGYPGGLRSATAEELRERKPEEILRHAVWGMLPNNKLRDRLILKLKFS